MFRVWNYLIGPILIATLCLSLDCEIYTEEKLYYSDVAAFGTPEKISVHNPSETGSQLYIVTFKVICVFKGEAPQFINFTSGGDELNGCSSDNVKMGENFYVYLDKVGGDYSLIYPPEIEEDYSLDDIPLYCDADITYPEGVDDPVEGICPQPYRDYQECVSYTPPETTQPVTTDSMTVTDNSGDGVFQSLYLVMLLAKFSFLLM